MLQNTKTDDFSRPQVVCWCGAIPSLACGMSFLASRNSFIEGPRNIGALVHAL